MRARAVTPTLPRRRLYSQRSPSARPDPVEPGRDDSPGDISCAASQLVMDQQVLHDQVYRRRGFPCCTKPVQYWEGLRNPQMDHVLTTNAG
jgi:hypothetical protein